MQSPGRQEYRYVPLSKQPGPGIHHIVTFNVELPPPDQLVQVDGINCGDCKEPFRKITADYSFGWGYPSRPDGDSLGVVLSKIPQIQCGCGFAIEDLVMRPINERGLLILHAMESEASEDLKPLESFMSGDDIGKVNDFTQNRKRPWQKIENTQSS